MTNIEAANVERLKMRDRWDPDRDSKFCLASLQGYQTDNADHNSKIADLLDGRVQDESTSDVRILACNIGGCTMQMAMGPEIGKKITGQCRAASYCLKQSFEAVKDTQTVEEGKQLYSDILDSLDGFTSSYSAGNFCPRLDCELSAGLSLDMVPGTAGECRTGDSSAQPTLPIDEA